VWGFWSSLVFGWAYKYIEASTKAKLFVIGDKDEFTSVDQYEHRIKQLKGSRNELNIIKDKNHFEIESPVFDAPLSKWILDFIEKLSNDALNLS
jgi:hypothetical protein